ncbi:MAG: protoporphyrinogen oxidase HemJ [Alphaproteobacteria bacterium]|nr:protoporphyrinogen oxidase HemJ [Alphaproteobacteria bacterium]
MELYATLRALHLIAVISWMAALLYLPRLFVYHAGVTAGSEACNMLKIMEQRLMRIIATPAMLATWFLGLWLISYQDIVTSGWLHIKLLLVLLLSGFHGACAVWMKTFARHQNIRPPRFYRIVNEVPTLLMVAIVFLVILKPF